MILTSVAWFATRPLRWAAAPWSMDSSVAHCRRTRRSRIVKISAATVTAKSGLRLPRWRPRAFVGISFRRYTDRDGSGADLDPQFPYGGACAAVKLVRDLPVEPYLEFLSASDVNEW